MHWHEVERTVSRLTETLHTGRDLRSAPSPASNGNLSQLGQAAITLVDEVYARISERHTRTESHLVDLLERLDAEEARSKKLEERIDQANSAAEEAELWLTRVMQTLKTRLLGPDKDQQANLVVAA